MSRTGMLYKVVTGGKAASLDTPELQGAGELAKGKSMTISQDLIAFRCPRTLALKTRMDAAERRVGISKYIRDRLAEAAQRERSDAREEEER